MSALCKICQSNQDVKISSTLSKMVKDKQWIIELKCGHYFDWESGNCYTKQDFNLGVSSISSVFV